MKKLILICLAIIAAFIISPSARSQKIGTYQSKWNSVLAKDQEEDLINRMQFHEKSQFLFLVSNDEKNLYIELIQADRTAVQKIMRFGLTTWFNPEGKHKKSMGIQFPVAPDENGDPGYRREKGGDRRDMMMAMMERKSHEMKLVGFEGKGSEKMIDPVVDSVFHGKVEMLEGGRLHVSIVLPLERLGRGSPETFIHPLSIGFETGYLDLTRSGMASSGGGQQSSGGGMHGGGGMYGGGPGGGPPPSGGGSGGQGAEANQQQSQQADISELASPSKLWISQVKLAGKP